MKQTSLSLVVLPGDGTGNKILAKSLSILDYKDTGGKNSTAVPEEDFEVE